jgi:hypothetical protein
MGQDPTEWLFRVESQISSTDATFLSAVSSVQSRLSNRNWYPEAGMLAIFQAAKRDGAIADGSFVAGAQPTPIPIGWNTDLTTHVRFIVVLTDSAPGPVDASVAGIFTANNLDGNMNGDPAGSAEDYSINTAFNGVCFVCHLALVLFFIYILFLFELLR